jgi:hypothetical protein
VFEGARRALDKVGYDAALLKEKTLQYRNLSYTITFVKTLDGKKAKVNGPGRAAQARPASAS